LFRKLELPPGVAGALYLHSMPGREEALEDAVAEMRRLSISRVVSLADLAEISVKSEAYAHAIEAAEIPATLASCPIPDRGVPEDPAAFVMSAEQTALALKSGEKILGHCGAGVGRTGTYAAAVLLRLGLSKNQALARVRQAGSNPETKEQLDLLDIATLKN